MRTFATDENNDLFIQGRSLAIDADLRATLDVCAHVAKAILGEMVFAQQQGMPYFETVWVGAPTTAPFEAAFRERVLAVPGVTNIEELTTAQTGDRMTYSATITTVYGTGAVDG